MSRSSDRICRVVLHVDMDAFYAAIEVRENPALRGRPVIIGHRGRRGVVSTCSYEARRFGVRSAMPSLTAERLCPDAIWLAGRMARYVEVSRSIRRILGEFSPIVEPVSIDEAFLDLSGIAKDLDDGMKVGERLRRRIRDEESLPASVGVAHNKFLAKIASDLDKPEGRTRLGPDDLAARFWPLPIDRLWGVGPATARRLRATGLETIEDLRRCGLRVLAQTVGGATAAHLERLAQGVDDRPVRAGRPAKTVSEERTYGTDLSEPDEIDRALFARADGVARTLRREGLVARTVHLKIRIADFTTWTRSRTLPVASDLPAPLLLACREMLLRVPLRGRGVRLLGVGVSGLAETGKGQTELFRDPDERRAARAAHAADRVRAKLGERALTLARLIRKRRRKDEGPQEASSPPAVD